jgi:hypothetical protein
MLLHYIYLTVLLICFIIGIVTNYLIKPVPLYLKFFPWFIFLTLLVEITGVYLSFKYGRNLYFYNVFHLLEFLFFGYILYQISHKANAKRVIIYSGCIYLSIKAISFFIQSIRDFHTWSYLVGAFLLVVISAWYLFDFFKESQSNPFRHPPFSISSGILFFYSCSIPLHLCLNFMINFTVSELKILGNIFLLINIIYYCLFSVAFVCRFTYSATFNLTRQKHQ